jgi:hypothetical protein
MTLRTLADVQVLIGRHLPARTLRLADAEVGEGRGLERGLMPCTRGQGGTIAPGDTTTDGD